LGQVLDDVLGVLVVPLCRVRAGGRCCPVAAGQGQECRFAEAECAGIVGVGEGLYLGFEQGPQSAGLRGSVEVFGESSGQVRADLPGGGQGGSVVGGQSRCRAGGGEQGVEEAVTVVRDVYRAQVQVP
jgi:hypothetical protein